MVTNTSTNVNPIIVENCWDGIKSLVADPGILELFNHLKDNYKSEYPGYDRVIKFQINFGYICTSEDPKPNKTFINRKYYNSINNKPSSIEQFELNTSGILEKPGFFWHTVEAPIGFFLELIQNGFIYRLAIKKNGNVKEHIVEVWGEGYDIDGIDLTEQDIWKTKEQIESWKEGGLIPCIHTSPTATKKNLKHRALLIYDRPITDYRIVESSLNIRLTRFGIDVNTIDKSCKDAGRFFYSRPAEEWRKPYEQYITSENVFYPAKNSFEAVEADKKPKSNVIPFKAQKNPGMEQTRNRVFRFIHDEIFRDHFDYDGAALYQAAIDHTGVGWDLEAKQHSSSDSRIEVKWKCSNPASIENKSKEGLCISYYPDECKPPTWCNSSSHETDGDKIISGGSIIDFIGWFTSDFQSHKVTDDDQWYTIARSFIESLGYEYPFVEEIPITVIDYEDTKQIPRVEIMAINFIKFLDRKVYKLSPPKCKGDPVYYYHNNSRYELIYQNYLRDQFADWFRMTYGDEPKVIWVDKAMKALLSPPKEYRLEEPIEKETNKFCFKNGNHTRDSL